MSTNHQQAFSRTELVVVVGVLTTLAALLLPALANPGSKSDSMICLGNLRRLIQAWTLYSGDNHGRLVMYKPGSGAQESGAGRYGSPWAVGWLDWKLAADNTNLQFLVDDRYSKLARYTDRNPNMFLCPADRFVSSAQKSAGWTRRSRSVSMNVGIGDVDPGLGGWGGISMHKSIKTIAEFTYPAPSLTFVFLDENPDSINDPGFINPQTPSAWIDQPASYHDGAGSFAFADGHVEPKKWSASLASPDVQQTHFVAGVTALAQKGDADIRWVNYRAGRVSTNSF